MSSDVIEKQKLNTTKTANDTPYAIFVSGGKQYVVRNGDKVSVERLAGVPGDEIKFGEVLFVKNETTQILGKSTLQGATVTAKVIRHLREKKLISFKKRRRKGYIKKIGHRQNKTEVLIESINI